MLGWTLQGWSQLTYPVRSYRRIGVGEVRRKCFNLSIRNSRSQEEEKQEEKEEGQGRWSGRYWRLGRGKERREAGRWCCQIQCWEEEQGIWRSFHQNRWQGSSQVHWNIRKRKGIWFKPDKRWFRIHCWQGRSHQSMGGSHSPIAQRHESSHHCSTWIRLWSRWSPRRYSTEFNTSLWHRSYWIRLKN